MRPLTGHVRFDSLVDDDDVPAEGSVRWSRWGRSARRGWQSVEAFSGRLAACNTRMWAIGFVGAWAVYGMYVGGQIRPALDGLASVAGFGLTEVEIRGLSRSAAGEITDLVGVAQHKSILSVSAEGVREGIAALPWIADVSVNKIYPGKLVVSLTERTAYALWQDDGKIHVIDRSGAVMTDQIEEQHLKLPLVVGQGANTRAGEALALMAASPVLGSRIHAAVLVAERRWNLVTNDGVEIRLPEEGATAALAGVARLQASKQLLDRDLDAVDVRTPDRLYLKLSDAAAAQRRDMLKAKTKKKGADT